MITLDMFYIISITETFQLIIPSVLKYFDMCSLQYLQYFLEKG